MRSNIFAQHLRLLSRASALLLVATVAACSNDAARFDEMVTSSISKTSNQSNIIHGTKKDVTFKDGVKVIKSKSNNQYSSAVELAPAVQRSSLPPLDQDIQVIKAAKKSSGVPSFPEAKAAEKTLVLHSRKKASTDLRVIGSDNITTGSIKKAVPAARVLSKPVGWKNTKGAWVTMRQGETLHNMSRRYGVPVMAIMSANKINNAKSVQAGQRILIPAYNYADHVPVSAPDSNPVTSASRASRGFKGQARGKVVLPKARQKTQQKVTSFEQKIDPKQQVTATSKSVGTSYLVKSGDTLFGIARRFGVSTAALRSGNQLKSDSLRIGQSLLISSARKSKKKFVSKKQAIDLKSTGSISSKPRKKSGINPVYTAPVESSAIKQRSAEKVASVAKTNSGSFRWPAQGRVIAKFGERSSTGTNDGIDISMPIGTPIKAVENGTVIYSGSELEDFGKLILVSHDGGWVSAYAHASAGMVSRGDKVTRGQVIAKSGKTGNAKIPKLHFELRKNSRPVNPLKHLSK